MKKVGSSSVNIMNSNSAKMDLICPVTRKKIDPQACVVLSCGHKFSPDAMLVYEAKKDQMAVKWIDELRNLYRFGGDNTKYKCVPPPLTCFVSGCPYSNKEVKVVARSFDPKMSSESIESDSEIQLVQPSPKEKEIVVIDLDSDPESIDPRNKSPTEEPGLPSFENYLEKRKRALEYFEKASENTKSNQPSRRKQKVCKKCKQAIFSGDGHGYKWKPNEKGCAYRVRICPDEK